MQRSDDGERMLSFEDAIEHARSALDEIGSDSERARREGAIEHFAAYVGLLREATRRAPGAAAGDGAGYWFKLELEDGRWTVEFQPLPEPPRVGDIIELEPASRWLVRRLQQVRPAPPRAPTRDFVVCAPVG